MKLLLDSANLDEIRQLAYTSAIAGVTTNPSLMAKEHKGNYISRIKQIQDVMMGKMVMDSKHLSVEVLTKDLSDTNKIVEDAVRLKDVLAGVDLYIKVPVLFETLQAITELAELRINVNATACFKASQAKLASDAGAKIVSFFYCRMKDAHGDGAGFEIAKYKMMSGKDDAKVICGSIRKPEDVLECWDHGADYVTAPMKVIREMLHHPKTDEAVKKFQEDIEKWQS